MQTEHNKLTAIRLAEAYKEQGNRFDNTQLSLAVLILRAGGQTQPLERIARYDLTVREALGRSIKAGPVECPCFNCHNPERRRNQ